MIQDSEKAGTVQQVSMVHAVLQDMSGCKLLCSSEGLAEGLDLHTTPLGVSGVDFHCFPWSAAGGPLGANVHGEA